MFDDNTYDGHAGDNHRIDMCNSFPSTWVMWRYIGEGGLIWTSGLIGPLL